MRLRGLIVLTALCAALGAVNAAPAAGALFVPCGANGLECVTVNVPLDRSGGTPGTVSLHVEELPAPGMPRGVLFLIAGGPGQASARVFDLAGRGKILQVLFPGYVATTGMARQARRDGQALPPRWVHRTAEQVSRAVLRALDAGGFEINVAPLETLAPIVRAVAPKIYRRAIVRTQPLP